MIWPHAYGEAVQPAFCRRCLVQVDNLEFAGSFHTSSHQPSSVLRFRTPLAATFIPLLPLGSFGRSGVFIDRTESGLLILEAFTW